MDELQATFVKDKLFVWGISSSAKEVFTPVERLEKICNEVFLSGRLNINYVELPVSGNVIVVPFSMRTFYTQFNSETASSKFFPVHGLEVDSHSIVNVFLKRVKKQGVVFGDSFEFFRMCIMFAFSLVSRQRFVPYYKSKQGYFVANLDTAEDCALVAELNKKAPLSIKAGFSEKTEDVVRNCIDCFVNMLISVSLHGAAFDIAVETETDKWLCSLLEKKTEVTKNVQKSLTDWVVARKVNRELEYNMLFKLEDSDGEWKVSFNLQSKKDPSLIVRLDELWRNPKKIPLKNIKTLLLMDLGTAAKFSRTVEKALYKPNPYEITLSQDEALGFISNDSLLLKDAGFAVQIPKITRAKTNLPRVKVRFKENSQCIIKGTGSMGRALFDFDYAVALGDLELTHEEFIQLAKRKEGLVNVKGKWVEVNRDEIRKVIDYFEKKEQLSTRDIFLINSSGKGFEISEVVVPKLYEEINCLFNFNGIPNAAIHQAFSGTLRPYQARGYSWMMFLRNLGFGGILADDMGLGKTAQAIAYLLASDKPSLVICPTSVLGNWQRELQKFSPSIKFHVHHGSNRPNSNEFAKLLKDNDVVVSSYALAWRDEKIFGEVEWDTIVLDEAQNIKNPFAKQSLSISRLKSRNRFCLTGTPVENRLSEFWSIMNFTNPGFLSDWSLFKKNFAEPIELENDKNKTGLLKRIISPFILRRMKTDKSIINDLPEKIEIKEYCCLAEEQASLYQAIVDDSLKKIKQEKENRRALIMAALIKLKQVCNHPSNYLKDSNKLLDRSGKVERLRELLEEILQNGEKCLVFTQFKEMGDLLKSDLEEYFDAPVCFLHGQQSRKVREQMIDYFQSDDRNSPKLFVLSLKAGGLGINLTKANNVIHFDRWWNPAVENQATDRAFRIGQERKVFVHKLITTGTVEEKIDEMIERKLALSNSLLASGEKAITELDDKQLRELFSLRKENLEG